MAETPPIDPRYDPAFQRGGSGAAAAATLTPWPGGFTRPGATPAQAPAALPPVAPAPAASVVATELPPAAVSCDVQGEPSPASETGESSSTPPLPPWRNPFVWAAIVLAGALIYAAVWIVQAYLAATVDPTATYGQNFYIYLQFASFAAPILFGLGLAILAGVLFLYAGYWARRPRAVATE